MHASARQEPVSPELIERALRRQQVDMSGLQISGQVREGCKQADAIVYLSSRDQGQKLLDKGLSLGGTPDRAVVLKCTWYRQADNEASQVLATVDLACAPQMGALSLKDSLRVFQQLFVLQTRKAQVKPEEGQSKKGMEVTGVKHFATSHSTGVPNIQFLCHKPEDYATRKWPICMPCPTPGGKPVQVEIRWVGMYICLKCFQQGHGKRNCPDLLSAVGQKRPASQPPPATGKGGGKGKGKGKPSEQKGGKGETPAPKRKKAKRYKCKYFCSQTPWECPEGEACTFEHDEEKATRRLRSLQDKGLDKRATALVEAIDQLPGPEQTHTSSLPATATWGANPHALLGEGVQDMGTGSNDDLVSQSNVASGSC